MGADACAALALPRTELSEWKGFGEGMLNENESPTVPISNWTLATGTRPGERPITDTEARL